MMLSRFGAAETAVVLMLLGTADRNGGMGNGDQLWRCPAVTPLDAGWLGSAEPGWDAGNLRSAPGTASLPLIPVYRPDLSGNERRYVLDCVDSSWISSRGSYVGRFERAVAELTGAAHAVAVCNGSAALHLALHCLDLRPGDEVIVPSFTYVASVNAVVQAGAVPVLADSRAGDWLLDPEDVARRITPRTRAILPVHLYGASCDMPALRALADRHGIALVEDCAEALGTTLDGRHVGRWGRAGAFSFFANKTVTTGEGGMVVTDDDALAQRLRRLKDQGQSPERRYWHEEMGFNYRMTNMAAAVGTAQMERIGPIVARKCAIAARYRLRLAGLPLTFQQPLPNVAGPQWLVTLLLPPGTDRGRVQEEMAARQVETRPVFHCAHHLPMYRSALSLPVAESIAARGLSLPSYPGLSEEEIDRAVRALTEALRAQGS